jgi:hypothetical protein
MHLKHTLCIKLGLHELIKWYLIEKLFRLVFTKYVLLISVTFYCKRQDKILIIFTITIDV